VNGRIKQWRFFNQIIQNSNIPFVSARLRIVCAFINAFGSRATNNTQGGYDMATQMRERFHKKNSLLDRLNRLNNQSHLVWKKYDSQFCMFPSLTEDQVRNIAFGNTRMHLKKIPMVFI